MGIIGIWAPSFRKAISSPIVADDLVLGVCGFTTLDKHLVAIRPASASQNGKAQEIWRMEETMPHIPSPLLAKNDLSVGGQRLVLPSSSNWGVSLESSSRGVKVLSLVLQF